MDLKTRLEGFGIVETNKSFKNLTTFKVGGNADYVFYPSSHLALKEVINILNNENIDYKVLGFGSNILASEDDYHGVIIRLSRTMNDYYFEDDAIIAMAGCPIVSLAVKAMENSLSGLEFACGIPATLGGCICNNAGAYKSDMSEIVSEVNVLIDNKFQTLTNQQCCFSYRHSIFLDHPDWVITSAKLKLSKKDREEISSLMQQRKERRIQSQPLDYPSCGSTFRNLDNEFAWKLIDGIGYRGKSIGGAQVSEKHSNFIINVNNATSNDINNLINEIQEKVQKKYNIFLQTEVEKFNWKTSK